jgi:hypothetical protein
MDDIGFKPTRFFPAEVPVKPSSLYYDIQRFIHHRIEKTGCAEGRYNRAEQLKLYKLDTCLSKKDRYAVSDRLMTAQDISHWRTMFGEPLDSVQQSYVIIPPPGNVGVKSSSVNEDCGSVSSSSTSISSSTPLRAYVKDSDAWRILFCCGEHFEKEYAAAIKQPFFSAIMDSIVPFKNRQFGANGLPRAIYGKLAGASWLCNPANIVWYSPAPPREGFTGTHAPFPMFWTQYYPQMKLLASRTCNVTIPPQSWLPLLKTVLSHIEFDGVRPFYADNPEKWMVGSGKSWSEGLVNQLKGILSSKGENKIDINSLAYTCTAEVCSPSFPTLTRTTGVGFAFGFKLTAQCNSLCRAMKLAEASDDMYAIDNLLSIAPSVTGFVPGYASPHSSSLSVGSSRSSTRGSKTSSKTSSKISARGRKSRAAAPPYTGRQPVQSYMDSTNGKHIYMQILFFDDHDLTIDHNLKFPDTVFTPANVCDLKSEAFAHPVLMRNKQELFITYTPMHLSIQKPFVHPLAFTLPDIDTSSTTWSPLQEQLI